MTLVCQFHGCGTPLTYAGKGQPPKYCPACKPQYLREFSARLYHQRNPQAGYKPRPEENPMTEPCSCPVFAMLFDEYMDAVLVMWPHANNDPQAAARITRARQAIVDHKRLRCCRHLSGPSSEGMRPRLVDTRDFDTPPLLAMMGAT